MAQTYRDRNIYEAALLVHDYHDTAAGERACAGDIIGVRKPFGHGEVGRAERSAYLWVRLEAQAQIGDMNLTQLNVENGTVYEKRRYCIPFQRLKQVSPWLDVVRVKDKADPYQPFMGGIDTEQNYDVHTFDSAFDTLVTEGKTPSQANAILNPLKNTVMTKRLGHVNPLDTRKLNSFAVYRFHDDGAWHLQLGGRQTGGHYFAPRAPLDIEGLVLDKATQRYL